METKITSVKVQKAKTPGKTIAYVKVEAGPLWVSLRLEKAGERYFLNPPTAFMESLRGRDTKRGKHSGWLATAGISREAAKVIKAQALAELGISEESEGEGA